MAAYYAEHEGGRNPFNWIRIHSLMSSDTMADYPFDHAGQGETALMLALCPEAVDMTRLGDNTGWYTVTAKDASAELGARGVEMIVERLRQLLRG